MRALIGGTLLPPPIHPMTGGWGRSNPGSLSSRAIQVDPNPNPNPPVSHRGRFKLMLNCAIPMMSLHQRTGTSCRRHKQLSTLSILHHFERECKQWRWQRASIRSVGKEGHCTCRRRPDHRCICSGSNDVCVRSFVLLCHGERVRLAGTYDEYL